MLADKPASAPSQRRPAAATAAAAVAGVGVRPEVLVMTGLLAAAFFALFFRWFLMQHQHSSRSFEDWGHAYFIPLISGYLVWRQREWLGRIRYSTFWPGVAPLVLGVMSYFFCIVAVKNHMLQGMSIILTLFGVLLLLLGPMAMRFLFLPIALLAFGITVSEIIMIRLTFPLQLIASQGAHVVLTLAGMIGGFGVDVAGNQLTLITSGGGEIPLNVAEACSGMRMVVAFFALAAITALLALPMWWQRVVLVLTAAPVAIFLNIGRVSVLGLLSLIDPALASGEVHMLIGTLLLIPGFFLFLALVWALKQVVAAPDPAPAGASAKRARTPRTAGAAAASQPAAARGHTPDAGSPPPDTSGRTDR